MSLAPTPQLVSVLWRARNSCSFIPHVAPAVCTPRHNALVMNRFSCLLQWGSSSTQLALQNHVKRMAAWTLKAGPDSPFDDPSSLCPPERAGYTCGQYFPSLVVFGTRQYLLGSNSNLRAAEFAVRSNGESPEMHVITKYVVLGAAGM